MLGRVNQRKGQTDLIGQGQLQDHLQGQPQDHHLGHIPDPTESLKQNVINRERTNISVIRLQVQGHLQGHTLEPLVKRKLKGSTLN